MITVNLIDDHPLITQGLKQSLEQTGKITVLNVAHSIKEGLQQLEPTFPDVILLDMKLPDGMGNELTCQIIGVNPKAKILILSSFNQQYYINSALKAGAKGYLLKNSDPDEIILAITEVAEGGTYLSDEVKKLMDAKKESVFISQREIEVLKLIANGLTNQEIADKLFISPLTADSHRKNLIVKLGAKNTASLINMAGQMGYL